MSSKLVSSIHDHLDYNSRSDVVWRSCVKEIFPFSNLIALSHQMQLELIWCCSGKCSEEHPLPRSSPSYTSGNLYTQ